MAAVGNEALGAFVVVTGAAALVMTGDWAARSTNTQGGFTDAGTIARLFGQHSTVLGSMFTIVLLDASIIGAAMIIGTNVCAYLDQGGTSIADAIVGMMKWRPEFTADQVGNAVVDG